MANPLIITWARESFGLEQSEAAKLLQISVNTLRKFEEGSKKPTALQLTKIARTFRRPLLIFYLNEPPISEDFGVDFRTTPSPDKTSEGKLQALVRNVKVAHNLLRSALEESGDLEKKTYVGSLEKLTNPQAIADRISELIDFSYSDFYSAKNTSSAFNALRSACENIGVVILLRGDLGSHHTSLDPSVFRGFALADQSLPLIAINNYDVKTAWSFTLLHELTHILFGETGVSSYPSEGKIEQFCDRVAAQFLLPQKELELLLKTIREGGDPYSEITDFSSRRNLGRGMVLYNVYSAGLISNGIYRKIQATFDRERNRAAEKLKEEDGGPSYYVVQRSRVGSGTIKLVNSLFGEGIITTTKASKILGVKPTSVPKLLSGT